MQSVNTRPSIIAIEPSAVPPTVSLAPELRGTPQPATVLVRGLTYPGEAIVAEAWDSEWGQPLSAASMFRVVLLTNQQLVHRSSIADPRIAVAIPTASGARSIRSADQAASDIRETRARYSLSGDPTLSSLGAALRDRGERVEQEIAVAGRATWARGVLVPGIGDTEPRLPPAAVFEGDDPARWVAAIAGELLEGAYRTGLVPAGRSTSPLEPSDFEAAWRWISASAPRPPAPYGAFALGVADAEGARAIDEASCAAITALDAELAAGDGVLSGARMLEVLVHGGGAPPEAASIYLAAHVAARDSELRLAPESQADPDASPGWTRLIRDSLERRPWRPSLVFAVEDIRSAVSVEWDTALGYLWLVLDSAHLTADGGGPDVQGRAFMEQLEALQSRFVITLAVLERLERTLGETGRTVNVESERLYTVVSSGSWEEFFTRARAEFGSVFRLSSNLDLMARSRRAGEDALEIELCARYLDEAAFGAGDSDLEIGARSLRSRIDLGELVENERLWPPLVEEFERWRARYRRAYLDAHRERRASDTQMAGRMERAALSVGAIESFAAISELGPLPVSDIAARWEELAGTITPCSRTPEVISLGERPYCEECRMMPGSAPAYSDVEAVMAEAEAALRHYNTRLSSAAVQEVLLGRREAEVGRLLRLNDAADLSALADILDADVVGFLRDFLRGSGQTAAAADGE